MRTTRWITIVALAATIVGGTISNAQEQPPENNQDIAQPDEQALTAVAVLAEYFDLLVSGNTQTAEQLWTAPVLERANRFGIQFDDIPLKVDCNSPLVRDIDLMQNYIHPTAKTFETLPGGDYVKMEYRPMVLGRVIPHDYYAYNDGQYFWLTHPQEYYTRGWPVIETEFVRLHYHPSRRKYLNDLVFDELDNFVEKTAKRLGMSGDQFDKIKEFKIEYYYCDADSTVKAISGHLTKGLLDLPTNDIISAYMPHYHELVHLLINITLKDLPLFTQPLLREGIAVYYGGRWGKAPEALFGLGSFLYREKIVDVDSLVTMRGFESQATSDIAYPMAGIFIGYLESKLGRDKLMDLYLDLSGPFDTVNAQSADMVEQKLADVTGAADWKELHSDFSDWLKKNIDENPSAAPGALAKGKQIARTDNYTVTESKDWVVFVFNTHGEDTPKGNLIFGVDERLKGKHSSLFEEQYDKNLLYEGHRWGVRYDGNEVGLYDYGSNELVAKYIWGLTPSDKYWDKEAGTISVSIRRSLIPDEAFEGKQMKLLPY